MLDEGIVQPSESPWSSPIVLEAGLKLNSKKCLFAAQEVKILGHLVSSNGVRPDPDKIKAKIFKRFLLSRRTLQSLLKSGVEFHWGPEEVEAFNSLKKALTGSSIGDVRRKSFYRNPYRCKRNSDKAEKNYSTTERECLAIVWATNKFRPYIFGKHFTVVTDHHSLCWLMNLKDLQEGLPDGWALDFKSMILKYKTGKKHSDADALRETVEEETETSDKFLAEEFDPDGKLWLPVIPKHLRADILRHFHDAPTAGTLVSRKLMTDTQRFYWPGMYRNVVRYVMHCRESAKEKVRSSTTTGRLAPIPPAIALPSH
ncbi:retrovirus-related Pol polyprotein from transposon 17.6 [Trichonephila clavipes]|nr:retrovirus-related Pol polyprotein from transposon 17.6 [Trichonephila clavipes]